MCVALVAAFVSPARATVESDLCTGNPCVVSSDITVDAGSVLDFTGQSLVIATGTDITVGPGDNARTLEITADDITFQPNGRILGGGDRAVVTLITVAGDIVLSTTGSNRSRIDVRPDVDEAGNIFLDSFGDALIDGILDASASGLDASAGFIDVRANGSITFSQDVTAEGSGDGASGGDIQVTAGGDVTIDDVMISTGSDFGAGDIDIFAAGTVTVNDRIELNGGDPDGEAGLLDIEAGVDVLLTQDGELFGRGGANQTTEDCGDGASISLIAGRHIVFDGDVDAKGGYECFGGDQSYEARLDFVQNSTSSIVTETAGPFGASGLVDITADRSATLGDIDLSAPGFASDLTVIAPLFVDVVDKVTVRGGGHPDAIGGRIEIQSCEIGILAPDGELDARSNFVFEGFGSTVLLASGLATISGDIQAAEPTESQPQVGNFVFYKTVPPSITGSVSPAAISTFDATLPECGYCGDGVVTASLGEQCDDGGTASCDGCAGYCQRPDDVCGDGIAECGEECDDGNLDPGDGCEPDCTIGPMPTPGPSPTPTPAPTATPEPTPDPTPTPTPDPTPTPSPTPDPTPTPAPTPDPTPSPTPDPTPTPGPTPLAGLDFYGITPCRVINTLTDPGPGGPAAPLSAGEERVFPISGLCGIPETAKAVSAVVTVVAPTTAGFVTLFPADDSLPTVSAVNYAAGAIVNNNLLLKLSSDGGGEIKGYVPVGQTHMIFDVNGYFE